MFDLYAWMHSNVQRNIKRSDVCSSLPTISNSGTGFRGFSKTRFRRGEGEKKRRNQRNKEEEIRVSLEEAWVDKWERQTWKTRGQEDLCGATTNALSAWEQAVVAILVDKRQQRLKVEA